ncbi:divalent cation tolerance protein CutA [Blastococcus sp. PRF04-17]|nr:divalent cation tolerance protein CutA [Blastococcus sp. PRF04-17]UOY04005.1 divalent cation tolerance protein CutA [Blastococcus sp. PRF04-17]
MTHDHHADNLDDAGRALLPAAGVVVTTVPGAARLGGRARALRPWGTTELTGEGRPTIGITATPARHGPPLSRPVAGAVIGFALRWPGQDGGVLWISGDTVLHSGVRQVGERLRVDTAVLHLGGVRFPITGPLRFSMTARQAVEVCRLLRPRTAIPVHYEGWSHFREGRAAIEAEFARAPADVRDALQWLPLSRPVPPRPARPPQGGDQRLVGGVAALEGLACPVRQQVALHRVQPLHVVTDAPAHLETVALGPDHVLLAVDADRRLFAHVGPLPARAPPAREDVVVEECCEVVVTGPDAEWLAAYTRTLVEEGLAACGHNLAGIRSIYRWDGAVQDEPEARVALHTRRSLVPEIVARTRELHPYDVPCVIALPLVGGEPRYLEWIAAETRPPRN